MNRNFRQRRNVSPSLKRSTTITLVVLIMVVFVPFAFLFVQEHQKVGATANSKLTQNPIIAENKKAGTTKWKSKGLKASASQIMQATIDEPSGKTKKTTTITKNATLAPQLAIWNSTIHGYADQTSVNLGNPINFYVGTSQATYTLDVYRMGWYGGTGATLMLEVKNLKGQNQAIPAPQAGTGLVECHWSVSYTLSTQSSWVSGVYVAQLTAADGTVSNIVFVGRKDGAVADIVYQLPVTTYEAYNDWGGKSLYDYNSTNSVPATKVSFDRPYSDEDWNGAGNFFSGDYGMIRWLEKSNYNVTYITSLDTNTNAGIMTNRKVFLSNYHDEYWSSQMRTNVTAARDQGKSLAFFGANSVFWQIRFEPSSTGVANRVMVCYKDASLDPLSKTQPALTTVNFRDPPLNNPENSLLGGMFESYYDYSITYPWVVQNANSWVYAGTGVKNGDSIPGVVGYEYDKVFNNGATPANLTVLSNSPIVDLDGVHSFSNGTIYTAPSNALVFNAGTIFWSWKVDSNDYVNVGTDARIQGMTANILNKMISGSPTSTPTPTATFSPTATLSPTATFSPTSTPSPTPSPTLTPSPTPSPTLTPSPTPSPTATGTPVTGLKYTVFGDALGSGWIDYSFNANVNYANTTPVYSGTRSISYTATAAWGGLDMHNNTPVSLTSYTVLHFAARATQANQQYVAGIYDASGNILALITFTSPTVGAWTVYDIPLASLNATGKQTTGVLIQSNSSSAQPALFVDEVGFN